MIGAQGSEETGTVTYIYRDMADEGATGFGTAFQYRSGDGGILNYCWNPSDSDEHLVLAYVFDESGTVTEISISDAERNNIATGNIVTPADMAFGEITIGMTRQEVRTVLGEPTKILDSDDLEENTYIYGHYFTWYYGDDFALTFYQFDGITTNPFKLGSVCSQSSGYQLSNGLTVGDTFGEVIKAYARDEHFGEDVLDSDGNPFGCYLYGGVTAEDFETLPLTKTVTTAYVNTYENSYTDDGTCRIEYLWYPTGSYGYENSYSLIFDISADKTVSCIRFYYNSVIDAQQAAQETASDETKPASEYPNWSTWTMPVERHELISYDELLAKMPAITPNEDASRFTAEDAVADRVRDGDTINSIRKKLGEPNAIYDDRDALGLMRFYMYDGVYFSCFKEISEDGGETYEKYEEGDIVMTAVIYGEGIEGPRGIKIGDSFESVMAMYPQDRDYLENAMFYGKYALSGPSGKVDVRDLSDRVDPFSADNWYGYPIQVILLPDGTYPFASLLFDDDLILREIIVCYEVYPFG